MLSSYEFLNQEEKDKTVAAVHELRDHWVNRGGYFAYPFFSLGAASYMDAVEDPDRYYQWAGKYNPIMKEKFSWLYDKVAKFLEKTLEKKIVFKSDLAIPGFHIFLADELFEIPVASRHCDLQFRSVNWGDIEFKPEDSISFTVYAQMPSSGGGLYLWDYTFEDLAGLDSVAREEKLSEAKPEYKQFDEGNLVIHTGFQYHQIAPMPEFVEGEARISLQGHGVLSDDTYYLYW